jgi:hypothetical protein
VSINNRVSEAENRYSDVFVDCDALKACFGSRERRRKKEAVFVARLQLGLQSVYIVYSTVSVVHADDKQVDEQDPTYDTCTLEQVTLEQVLPHESRTISVLRFIHDFTVTPKPQLFRQDVTMAVALKALYLRQHVLKGWLGQSESQPWGF